MTSLFGKIGIGAEKVYNVTSYPIAWTQSLYGLVTDYALLPAVKGIWNKVRPASESLDHEKELPKRPKRCGKCFNVKSLFKACKTIKEYTYTVAHAKATKLPDPEGLDRFDQIRNDVCLKAEKTVIQAFRIIYVVAEIGEKPVAVRLYLTEMGFELRPCVMKHVVQPIFNDIKGAIAGPEIDSSSASWGERFASGLRSGAGDFFEKKGQALTNQYLEGKEEQITQSLTAIEGQAQGQAIILLSKVSNYMLREGLYFIVTPWVLSNISSPIVSSIGYYTGYVETVNTVAYLLSYLKYAAWAKTAFIGAKKLYESCPPELTDEVRKQLYSSFSCTTNPSEELRKYPDIVITRYDLPSLAQKYNVSIIELVPPLEVFIKGSDSETLKKLQKYSENFLKALKVKSDRTLRKYDLMDSPKIEEIIEEEVYHDLDHPEAAPAPTAPSLLTTVTSPKESKMSDGVPPISATLAKTAGLAKDALALYRGEKKDAPAPSPSLAPFFDRAVEVTDAVTALIGDGEDSSPHTPPPSSPEPSDSSDPLFSPTKTKRKKEPSERASFSSLVKGSLELFEAATSSSPATPPPPKATSSAPKPVYDSEDKLSDAPIPVSPGFPKAPTLTDRTTLPPPPKATSAELRPADGAREEPKGTPPAQPHWIRRAAVVTIIAGAAIVIGIKVLQRFSLIPTSFSRFSMPTNLEDSNVMKMLSSLAKFLIRQWKNSSVNGEAPSTT